MFHALRGHILSILFCAVLLSLSMAKAAVAIPPDVLEAARLAAIPLPEHPASGESPTLPTEEVVYFLLLFLWCAALSICCVCYAELRPAMVVLVNTHRPLCRSSLLFLFVATVVAFLTCVTFILVSWWFSYFALHLVSWPLSLTGFSHGVLRLQVSTFLALDVCSIVLYFVLPLFF